MVEMEDAVVQDEETTQPSAAYQAMMQFCSANSNATTLLHTAAHDYAAARCLLLNGLVSGGLVMGAQAIEKFLKAYILLKNPATAVRQSQHLLTDLLKEADQLAPGLGLSKFSVAMSRYEDYYRNRYPDNKVQLPGMYSWEYIELDEFIIFLNESLPMLLEAKYRTGLYALVTFSLHGRTVPPWETWIKHLNQALAPRWPQIEADFRIVLKNLHPETSR
jgi:HEPN domain-containing protein